MPQEILEEFDRRLNLTGSGNRSGALRKMIRQYITEERWREEEGLVYGTLTLMYDHHSSGISKDLTALQHDYGELIVCTTHVHVNRSMCLECIVLRGQAVHIKMLVDAISKVKGLKSVDRVITSDL